MVAIHNKENLNSVNNLVDSLDISSRNNSFNDFPHQSNCNPILSPLYPEYVPRDILSENLSVINSRISEGNLKSVLKYF